MPSFSLSKRSMANLNGVHPDLVQVVTTAIGVSGVDFSVIEGVRTLARQQQLVASGASQTLKSRHLTGHAVDLAPYVGGTIRWDWPLFPRIAEAMRVAAQDHGVEIVWGAAWEWPMSQYHDSEKAAEDYVSLRRSQNRKPFVDGPHFELWRERYP